jgi:prepilin-type N-terminal cleavage/methylation domain-containing protein
MRRNRTSGFTLIELLVAIVMLALLVLLVSSILNSTTKLTSVSTKRMEADSEERQLLDRMAIDFAQMVKRKDISYYMKTAGTTQTGNDLIAFFSAVPGYYPATSYQSPLSLVAYRVNSAPASKSYNRLERMAKGLQWNGYSASYTPILFNTPIATTAVWSAAASTTAIDNDYEVAGSRVFRFEYYYLLKPDASGVPRNYSNGGFWPGDTTTFTVGDVAAIVVAIAVMDPASRSLLSNAQLATLAGSTVLRDAGSWGTITTGQLLSQWQTALNAVTNMPHTAISNVRLYERYFYLSSPAP